METKISRRKLMPSLGAAGAAMMVGNNLLSKPPTAAAHTVSDTVFNVKSYGAVGDGVANDTAAIQTAVNAAGLVQGTVFFPSGTYRITQINVNAVVKLEGIDASVAGSRLASAANAPMLYVTTPCTIENLALIGSRNASFTRQDGIFIDNSNDVYVRNVFLVDMYNCIHIKDRVFYSFFDNVRFYSAENCLVYGEGAAPEGYAVQFNNCQATINYLPFLPQSNVKRISVMGGKMGGSANPIDLSGDYTNAIANVFGYKKLQNEGIYVADGAPVLTYYIPHGLAATPRSFNVQEGSQAAGYAEIHCVERDATNLIVSLKNFPAIGVNNLVFNWSAKV
jgi:Pectate lyase superfamily protein